MNTRDWGPPALKTMFMIAFNYPVTIDKKNRLHISKMNANKTFFTNFGNVLPCKYCRCSYRKFLKELPIKNYLHSRKALTYWVYLIKDKINKKLIKQEKDNVKKGYPVTFFTKKSPPFKKVCELYEKSRAKCSQKTKSCSKPTIKELNH